MASATAMAFSSAAASRVSVRPRRGASLRGWLCFENAAKKLLTCDRHRRVGSSGPRGPVMTRGRQPGGVVTTAKIWTDDGRRRAADLMGLTREEASDPKTLKRAFRKLCLRYHPDIARADDAADKFHELQEAYQVLATSEDASDFVELPDHLEWSAHDWRWAARYAGTSHAAGDGAFGGGDSARSSPITDPVMRPMEESERKAKLDAQLGAMAAAPVKRRRRVVKPLSTTPTPVPAAVQFTDDATTNEDANETKEDTKKEDDDNDDAAEAAEECPTDGCSSDDDLWNGESVDFQSMDENEKRAYAAFAARKTRGYQSDRHSTESAHSRLNGQLAGLHRKKVIRQRATGEIDLEDFKKDFKKNGGTGNKSAARRDGRDHEVRDETNAARFYGGGGLQLEESTPERFLRLAKLAREWREQRSMSDAIYSADIIKPSAKELLQAAVEGVSLGACT